MSSLQKSSVPLNLAALRCAAGTDIGMHRRENQDSFGIIRNRSFHAYFVADGMGGTQGGALASRMAISGIETELHSFSTPPSSHDLQGLLSSLNKKIFLAAQQDPNLAGMGTTIVGLVFSEQAVIAVHVGDSRAYRVRGSSITQLTEDHTLIKELIKTGSINPSEEKTHPIAHMLTKSLGPVSHVHADCNQYNDPAQENDTYILCSDGLYNYITPEEMLTVVLQNSPDDASQILINLANQRGGADNITILVISVSPLKPHNINRTLYNFEELISDEDTEREHSAYKDEQSKQHQIIPPPIQEPKDLRAERRSLREKRENSDARSPLYGTPLLLGFTLILGLLIGSLGKKLSLSPGEDNSERDIDSKPKATFSEIIAKMTQNSSVLPAEVQKTDEERPSDYAELTEKLSDIQRLLKLYSPTRSEKAIESIQTLQEKLRAVNASLTAIDKQIEIHSRTLKLWMDRQLILQAHDGKSDLPNQFNALGAYSEVIKQQYIDFIELSYQLSAKMDELAIYPDDEEIQQSVKEMEAKSTSMQKVLYNEARDLIRSSINNSVESLQDLQTKRKLLEREVSGIEEQISILGLLDTNADKRASLGATTN